MMSSTGGRQVLQQVSQFWSMLDDLSENDPVAYSRFIEEQMNRGAEFNAPPELHSCVRTQILEPKPGWLYINICSWKRVPAPQNLSCSPHLYGGKLETIKPEDQGWHAVLDVALNPAVLQKRKDNKADINDIYKLALSFAQQQHRMLLSAEYSIVSCGPNSNRDDLRCRLGFQKLPSSKLETGKQASCSDKLLQTSLSRLLLPSCEGVLSVSSHQFLSFTAGQTPASLLQRISSQQSGAQEEDSKVQIICRPVEHIKNDLIQVISSTFQGPQEPEYLLEVKTDAAGVPRSVKLTVDLPKVRSMSECQLRISKEDVVLQVEDVYYLLLELPKTVNEDTASAVFYKKKRRLTLTADVL